MKQSASKQHRACPYACPADEIIVISDWQLALWYGNAE